MKTFEYKIVEFGTVNIKDLNHLGGDGWQPAINLTEYASQYTKLIFKKETNQFKPQPFISDEEIQAEAKKLTKIDWEVVFIKGAKWLRDRLTTQKDNNGWVSVDNEAISIIENLMQYG